ncbi:MAG: hypothetical protein R2795_06425 [Saprospiraceae bacterium]
MRTYFVLIVAYCCASSLIAQTFTLGGVIRDAAGEAIGSMTVNLLDENGATIASQAVGCDGVYQFETLTGGTAYTLQPVKDGNILNGVSTFDLVLTSRHLLGAQEFTTPYQFHAADFNGSGHLSVLDILYYRYMIVGLLGELPGSNWLFFAPDASTPSDEFTVTLFNDMLQYDLI